MLNLLKHEIKSRWGAVLGWGTGLFLFGITYILIYPQIEEQLTALSDWGLYRAMGFDMGSFEGFLGSTVVLFLPVWLGIYVIIASTHTLTGEEEQGTLELLLAAPLRRWQILTAKMIAIGLTVFMILVIAGLGNALVLGGIKTRVAVNVTPGQLFIAVINGWPLLMVFIVMGLFLGAFMPTRKLAAITLSLVFFASYMSENLASHVRSLAPLKPYSLFSYFDTSTRVFSDGVQARDVLILLAAAAVFFVLALVCFQRRNITVGAWPWQRVGRND